MGMGGNSQEGEQSVPERPCTPKQPEEWSGVKVDLNSVFAMTPVNWVDVLPETNDLLGGKAYFKFGTTNMPSKKINTRIGSAIAAADTTAASVDIKNSGHVFGRLGQGEMAMPHKSKPFRWSTNDTTDRAYMILSLFPTSDTYNGLTGAETIEISAKASPWEDLRAFGPPPRPQAPK